MSKLKMVMCLAIFLASESVVYASSATGYVGNISVGKNGQLVRVQLIDSFGAVSFGPKAISALPVQDVVIFGYPCKEVPPVWIFPYEFNLNEHIAGEELLIALIAAKATDKQIS
ncbi:MAG: hypothetical protein HY273_07250, partial [Gammaproteobacteria bacterium]|nr:hypothetical protein [Gammaproteobacteria bacterium]